MEDFDWDNKPEDFDDEAKLLFQYVIAAHKQLERVPPEYCIVFENPVTSGTSVCTPAPEWMAMALHGDLLPVIEVYHRLRVEWTDGQGNTLETDIRTHPGKPWLSGKVTNGWLLHAGPRQPAMTQEEAMEYLLEKDVPRSVWEDYGSSNRRKFAFCRSSNLPDNRKFRDAWTINQGAL